MTESKSQVSSFWHGGKLPPYCWLSLKSFIDHGHAFTLYCYREVEVPAGVKIGDAESILPQTSIFYQQKGFGAGRIGGFTDLFRFKLLAEQGGWWVDTDVVCLSPTLPDQDMAFGWESEDLIGTAVLKLPRGHPLALELFQAAQRTVQWRGADFEWGEIGPRLLTQLVRDTKRLPIAAPTRSFYPTHWREANLVLLPEFTEHLIERTKTSFFLHLWNEVFRNSGVDIWERPPEGSYLSLLFARHGAARS